MKFRVDLYSTKVGSFIVDAESEEAVREAIDKMPKEDLRKQASMGYDYKFKIDVKEASMTDVISYPER